MSNARTDEITILKSVPNRTPLRVEMPDGTAMLTSVGVIRTLCDEAFGRTITPPSEPRPAGCPDHWDSPYPGGCPDCLENVYTARAHRPKVKT